VRKLKIIFRYKHIDKEKKEIKKERKKERKKRKKERKKERIQTWQLVVHLGGFSS
jgi:hypothetical protein